MSKLFCISNSTGWDSFEGTTMLQGNFDKAFSAFEEDYVFAVIHISALGHTCMQSSLTYYPFAMPQSKSIASFLRMILP